MLSLNKFFGIGNLTENPTLRYTPNGDPVTTLRLALNNSYKTSSGEYKNDPCYITAVVWGKQAEACNTHLIKGSGVMVEGRLKYRSWKNKEDKIQSTIEIRADRVQFMPKNVKESEVTK